MNTTITKLVFLLAVAAPLVAHRAEAARIYVNAQAKSATPDGTAWKTAYVKLQDALDRAAATPGSDEIWIARGTYTPTKIYAPGGVTGGASGLNAASLRTFDLPDHVTPLRRLRWQGENAGATARRRGRHDSQRRRRQLARRDGRERSREDRRDRDPDGLTIRDGHAQGAAGGDLLFAPVRFRSPLGAGLHRVWLRGSRQQRPFLNNVATR
jgi:hypothetical protein